MVIDIISYTDAQFAALSEEQILEVKSAQLKKNKLDLNLEENLLKAKQRLIENGTFLSDLFSLQEKKLRDNHALEIERLREGLLFYLQFSGMTESDGELYELDYSLSMHDRYERVKNAYISAYPDGQQRFEAFKADRQAVTYLGEYYSVLYELFINY